MQATLTMAAAMVSPPFHSLSWTGTSMLTVHLLMELFAIVIAVLVVAASWHAIDERNMRGAPVLIADFVAQVLQTLRTTGAKPGLLKIELTESLLAEGVEQEGQRAFLGLHGCKAYQGYLFYRPMPIAQLDAIQLSHTLADLAV